MFICNLNLYFLLKISYNYFLIYARNIKHYSASRYTWIWRN